MGVLKAIKRRAHRNSTTKYPNLAAGNSFCTRIAVLQISLLHEFHWVSFKSLLTGYAAKMIGLAIVGDLELGCLLIQNGAANGISRHYFCAHERIRVLLIIIVDKKRKKCVKRTKILANKLNISFFVVFVWNSIFGSIRVCFRQV